jgi:hypothetical protein
VSEPGLPSDVPDADRAEQRDDDRPVVLASESVPPGPEVPEADAIEQQIVARPREGGGPYRPVGDREADEADVAEQETEVPVDDPEDDLG